MNLHTHLNNMSLNKERPAENQASAVKVNNVAIGFPPFFSDDRELWFQVVDVNFRLAGVTDEQTKYHYLIVALDRNALCEVRDLVLNPPQRNPYSVLKKALISRWQKKKLCQLLEREEMGLTKPSQFLRRLKELAGPGVSDSMLRNFWIKRLPSDVQEILETKKNVALDDVAELVDLIIESRICKTEKQMGDERLAKQEVEDVLKAICI